MSNICESYDIAVIGAGHAGCEAALASARLGMKTIVFTVSVDNIAMMPCNPNIGGTSKGHLVREIDALGGEMGKNIDKCFIQSKMLNTSKGPAVHSLRAQADKKEYSREMRKVLENTKNIVIKQAEITDIIVSDNEVKAVKTVTDAIYPCKCAILCTGVYLNSRCITGNVTRNTGPNGLQCAVHLTDSLVKLGIRMRRFKTGTPARIDSRTIDFSKMKEQKGDVPVIPFSFSNFDRNMDKDQVSCWLTYTNTETHKIIMDNIDRSPLYSGFIKSTGPRYCPSIEDKVMRFKDKDRHQVFIEPEGYYTNEMYIDGMSSSMPEDVQIKMYRSVAGLENAQIVRNAYAIEYDCLDPLQLKASLELKNVSGLFSAGQANGSSGYEEAAAQGIIAGINAVQKILNKEPLVIDRSQGYIGVLIDDLITKGTNEPYRMMTSRAEYRLLLRQDNADIRLMPEGHKIGLVSDETYNKLVNKINNISHEIERLKNTRIGPSIQVNAFLREHDSSELSSGISLYELIKRPELDYDMISELDYERKALPSDVCEEVNIEIKYEGYIKRQMRQVENFKKMERLKIPDDIDYEKIGNIRTEAVQKLKDVHPENIGQASRISGVSPSDISVMIIFLKTYDRSKQS